MVWFPFNNLIFPSKSRTATPNRSESGSVPTTISAPIFSANAIAIDNASGSSGFGETDYEGYVWLDGGFKFVGPNAAGAFAWGNTDWGDDGSFSGVLAESGESDITAAAGYYRVNANTTTLLYTIVPTNWGIVGAATPGGWDNSTALTYNPSTKNGKELL